MKNRKFSSGAQGFSLIELMVVIGIIVLLAGMLIASLPGIQNRINRSKVTQLLAELEGGLSGYHIDNGIYPQNPASGDRDATGLLGSTVLYKHLSGDWDLDGKTDEDEEIYVPKLDYDRNKNSKAPRSTPYQGSYAVVDSYNSPMRYLADPPNITADQRKTVNPTYDLWSIVDTEPGESSDSSAQAKYITNWQAN